ncbi:hypothetical protein QBC32DRAFT_392707 [Pseudoneurospora amorphoporcata]|uniref:Uncharacterized protein n=1 Tax=Pseudoneurospora amorphoporcata TaxID=241081 RepID=A0AAN6P1Z5_9PEZI|nr:hypothetical protein QBC32DRAFT_392707 [Pseudoneurospora amorphoporcata]
MPKLRTFITIPCDFDTYLVRCGRELVRARSRYFRDQRWPCACRPQPSSGENAPANGKFLKGAELYLLPALTQKNVVNNRWLQLHWQSSTYFMFKPPQVPLQLMHVPCLSDNLGGFVFNIGRIDSSVGEPAHRERHLEMQHRLLSCLANAQNLRTLRVTASQRFPASWACAKKARDHYFFDLLVGQAAGPNRGELYLPKLVSLRPESVSFGQASLIKFIARHANTLRDIQLDDCRLEFNTVKRLARLPLHLDRFEVTSVTGMMRNVRRMGDQQYHFFGGRWPRVFEYIAPESLLRFINNTTPAAAWPNLEPSRFGRIPYQAHFNFLVTTEDVKGSYRVMGADGFIVYGGHDFEDRWETLVEKGMGIDFRQPSHPEMAICLGDEYGEGMYYPDDGAVTYPTGEAAGLVTAELALLEKLKRRALELSLSPEDMEEVHALMNSCKREGEEPDN